MTKDEVLKLALEALEKCSDWPNAYDKCSKAVTALREALAEQPAQQEPVAIRLSNGVIDVLGSALVPIGTLLYTTPPQRKPLTADELKEPKNGEQWHIVWWNESCRMMLPFDAKLDSFTSYKNGTLQFTIKKAAHGIKENT